MPGTVCPDASGYTTPLREPFNPAQALKSFCFCFYELSILRALIKIRRVQDVFEPWLASDKIYE